MRQFKEDLNLINKEAEAADSRGFGIKEDNPTRHGPIMHQSIIETSSYNDSDLEVSR